MLKLKLNSIRGKGLDRSKGAMTCILCQLAMSIKLIPGQKAKVLFVATSNCLHSQSADGELQTAVVPLLGLVIVAY